jgi:hypothetical protein
MLGWPRWWVTAEKLTGADGLLAAAPEIEIRKPDAEISQSLRHDRRGVAGTVENAEE